MSYTITGNGNKTSLTLTWNDNSINETAFVVQKSSDGIDWTDLATDASPLDQPNAHGTRSYTDTTFRMNATTFAYRVVAQNTVGYGAEFPALTVKSISAPVSVIPVPSNLTATVQAGPQVRLAWTDNTSNETGFVIERAANGGAFTLLTTAPAHANTGSVTYTDTTVVLGNTYTYRVAAATNNGTSVFSNTATANVTVPAAPSNLTAFPPIPAGNNQRVMLSWADNANNESGFTIQWSSSSAFTTIAGSANVGANGTAYVTGNIARQIWYFRIRANNVLGSSGWATTGQILPASVNAETPARSPLVFLNSFSNGFGGWNGQVGNVQAGDAAAMGGGAGQGLVAAMGDQPAYVYHRIPAALGSFMANLYFNPNGAITSATPVDIFAGLDANGAAVFGVQFLHTAGASDPYQIRGWAKTPDGPVYTEWAPIANAEQNIQLDWQSDLNSSLNLYVEGDVVATITADTSLYSVIEERLGPSIGDDDSVIVSTAGVTATTSGAVYLDEFISLSIQAPIPFTIYIPMLAR